MFHRHARCTDVVVGRRTINHSHGTSLLLRPVLSTAGVEYLHRCVCPFLCPFLCPILQKHPSIRRNGQRNGHYCCLYALFRGTNSYRFSARFSGAFEKRERNGQRMFYPCKGLSHVCPSPVSFSLERTLSGAAPVLLSRV